MFANHNGRLLVYASKFATRKNRLKPISKAAARMAKQLRFNLKVRTIKEEFIPIYVYYEKDGEEPIPIYCNNGKKPDAQEVYTTLKNMIFVLSFHPRHLALRSLRKEVTQFS